ncbi:MAG: site-specific integrase, partial [Rudaea sp.]
LITMLRARRQIRQRPADGPRAIHGTLQTYDEYLRDTCGLSEATRLYRRRYAMQFLHELFGEMPIRIRELTPQRIAEFFTRHAERCRPGSAQVLASSLRSYLRFEQLRGHGEQRLIAAVPSIPQWRLAALPNVLTDTEVQRLLAAFDRRSPTGLRDYAITCCVADLALRASEVAQLQLDSIDWRNGQILLRRSKPRRYDALPLPTRTAQALVAYLRRGRPRSTQRALFVRHAIPIGASIGPGIVRNAVRYAARRCGLADRCRGTHILRHTAATRLLRAGASLKEIADILGHRSLDTTTIYTKVDLPRLAAVALPWPRTTS